jgi:hypothetical protein
MDTRYNLVNLDKGDYIVGLQEVHNQYKEKCWPNTRWADNSGRLSRRDYQHSLSGSKRNLLTFVSQSSIRSSSNHLHGCIAAYWAIKLVLYHDRNWLFIQFRLVWNDVQWMKSNRGCSAFSTTIIYEPLAPNTRLWTRKPFQSVYLACIVKVITNTALYCTVLSYKDGDRRRYHVSLCLFSMGIVYLPSLQTIQHICQNNWNIVGGCTTLDAI